ncbi:hat family dimerization domaincontaining protein-related [Holotrichia oblita]|uniref:Hat family dimerization domaincontaining protein-related n=1 Tax=Holotrichia oblita TaxID=644536 RepID=A0ACB9SLD1_HOLOL|nr:hat family dimerization domaincontaining protein-related [Holotrichia oblita]
MMNLLESSDDEDVINYIEHPGRVRRPRINCRRPNNFEIWDDHNFFVRYRLQKDTVRRVLNRITNITSQILQICKNASLRPEEMPLLTLRFYATGSFLNVVGDLNGVHKATASKIVRKVSDAIASLSSEYIRLPRTNEEIQEVMGGFYDIASFPRVIGTIDCTHLKIQSSGI